MLIYVGCYIAMFLTAPFIRRPLTSFAFVACLFFFVAFRNETGFDWPVYKTIYKDFQASFSIQQVFIYQLVYNQEPGFLLTLGVFAKILPGYQYAQVIFSLLFFSSTLSLCRAFKVTNVALVLALVMSYLMLTVGFSTIRQSLAISFFNYGLASSVTNKRWRSYAMFFVAINFQFSAVIYVAALIGARMLARLRGGASFAVFVTLSLGLISALALSLQIVSSISPYIASKIEFYTNTRPTAGLGLAGLLLFVTFLLVGTHTTAFSKSPRSQPADILLLRSLILILTAICIASSFVAVIRDRASYELWMLYSLYLGTSFPQFKWLARGGAFAFGTVFSFFVVFTYPAVLAFVPYQNSITLFLQNKDSNGATRQQIMFDEIDE